MAGGDPSAHETISRLSVAVEIISRHAAMPPNSLGLIRMWMKALFLARPENPELFSFLLMHIVDFLDKKLALHHDFYSNDSPQLDKADAVQEDFARWEREKLSKRVAAIKHNFHSHAAEETQALLREVRENMESGSGGRGVQNRLIEGQLRDLRADDDKLDDSIRIRPAEDERQRISPFKKTHEQLLRDLVRRVKLRDTLHRKLTEAEKQRDAVKVEALKREVSRFHLASETTRTVERVFFDDSDNDDDAPQQKSKNGAARKRVSDPTKKVASHAALGTAASKVQAVLARQQQESQDTAAVITKVADVRTFDSIKTGESAQQYNARKKPASNRSKGGAAPGRGGKCPPPIDGDIPNGGIIAPPGGAAAAGTVIGRPPPTIGGGGPYTLGGC